MFSTTTMPLSTSSPRAITSAAMDICCSPNPAKYSIPMPIIIAIGITVMVMKDERMPRNTKMTIDTSSIPCIRFQKNPLMRSSTADACSNATSKEMSAGSCVRNCSSAAIISEVTCTMFLPGSRFTVTKTARSPLYRPIHRMSSWA